MEGLTKEKFIMPGGNFTRSMGNRIAAAIDSETKVSEATKVVEPVKTGHKLTKDQEAAEKFIEKELFSNNINEACLCGFAGSGKTWLTGRMIEKYLKDYPDKRVACVAPTNKAVNVVKKLAAVQNNSRLWYGTLHGFLGLKPRIDDDTGIETFQPDPYIHKPGHVNLLVVDESSMVGRDLMGHTYNPALCSADLILWVGDPAQLPPVGELTSPTLLLKDTITLREIVRHGGIIQSHVTKIRESIENGSPLPEVVNESNNVEGVFSHNRNQWVSEMLETFKSEEFNKDSDFVRALAWTNKAVNWGNNLVHESIYGVGADPFVAGQILVAQKPVKHPALDKQFILATSDECRVIKATRLDGTKSTGWSTHWGLTIDVGENGCPELHDVIVIDPNDETGYINRVEELKIVAMKTVDKQRKRWAWSDYYRYIDEFAQLRRCYWLTVHKAQGSTFQRVFVATPDIMNNNNVLERKRMLYTASTRAAKQLHTISLSSS